MSARREKRFRKLERRVEALERIASPMYFGTVAAPGALDADYQVLHTAGKRSLLQRIKDFFRKEV